MGSDKNQNGLKKVKEIIELMIENDLVEIEIADGDSKVHLKRPGHAMPQMMPQAIYAQSPTPQDQNQGNTEKTGDDAKLVNIESPMVGTFYASPSPDSEAYVKPGDSVTAETVVCIIEAMKVMNEIKAEISGTIEKILLSNGQAVEFGQTLFKVRPL